MGRARLAILAATGAVVVMHACAGAAVADGPVGSDPSSNFPAGRSPLTCDTAPTGPVCMAAAVQYLDQARANLGQPPYQLPANFVSLSPEQQTLVLTNLDRIQYGLPPVPGLTARLSRDAAGGVQADNDPETND